MLDAEDWIGINEPETILELWDEFLEAKDCYADVGKIVDKLLAQGVIINENLNDSEVNAIGWQYVKRRLREIEKNIHGRGNNLSGWEEKRLNDNTRNYHADDDYFEACQTTSCMCSDPT